MENTQTPAEYLKEVYGLEPGDLNLQSGFDLAEVKRLAKKFNLSTKQDINRNHPFVKALAKKYGYEF